jgi:hypothetical protein
MEPGNAHFMEKCNYFILADDLDPVERAAASLIIGQAVHMLKKAAPRASIVCCSEHEFETKKNPLVGHEADAYSNGAPPRADLPSPGLRGMVLTKEAAMALHTSGDRPRNEATD